jgi:hypothetical protein
MNAKAGTNDDASDTVAAYASASEAALESARQLTAAWRRHFESGAEEPSQEWIAEVAARQGASDLAFLRARSATAQSASSVGTVITTRRKRRRDNRFLKSIGRPGQKILRGILVTLLVLSAMIAVGAGISLTLEMAGFLGLIDDPTQLPVGIQLGIFAAGVALSVGLRKLLKPMERALYGSKGIRPKTFPP